MNSKGHLYASLIKSAIRIGGGFGSITAALVAPSGLKVSLVILAFSFIIAEIFGVFEEFKDER